MKRIGVIGGGISGLVAAAFLAKVGHRVTLFERARFAGGVAGSYVHQNRTFPTGATITFGLEPDGVLTELLADIDIHLPTALVKHPMDVVLDDRVVQIVCDETAWMIELERVFPEHRETVMRFWRHMHQTAQSVLAISQTRLALPLTRLRDLGSLPALMAAHPFQFTPLLSGRRKTVLDVMRAYGIEDYRPFRRFLDAQLIDAAQTTVEHAAWLPSAVALDIYRNGVYAVDGGFERIIQALVTTIERAGGLVLLKRTIVGRQYQSDKQTWQLTTHRREHLTFDEVINATGNEIDAIDRHELTQRAKQHVTHTARNINWGAIRLDAIVPTWWRDMVVPTEIHTSLPFAFQFALSGRLAELAEDPSGALYVTFHPALDRDNDAARELVLTASMHTPASRWMSLDKDSYERLKTQLSELMLKELDKQFPTFSAIAKWTRVGTPRTYHRYLLKSTVGGVPLTPESSTLHPRGSRTRDPHWYLAGDCVFPGPGTLSAALSGFFAARSIDRNVSKIRSFAP